MFIHLGGDIIVPKEEVIVILNNQLTKRNEINREFMEIAENDGFISLITERSKAKAIIITTKTVYFSPISSTTLKKRSNEIINTVDRTVDEELQQV